MPQIDRLLAANEAYAAARANLTSSRPGRSLAVVTCMDARIGLFAPPGLHRRPPLHSCGSVGAPVGGWDSRAHGIDAVARSMSIRRRRPGPGSLSDNTSVRWTRGGLRSGTAAMPATP